MCVCMCVCVCVCVRACIYIYTYAFYLIFQIDIQFYCREFFLFFQFRKNCNIWLFDLHLIINISILSGK